MPNLDVYLFQDGLIGRLKRNPDANVNALKGQSQLLQQLLKCKIRLYTTRPICNKRI